MQIRVFAMMRSGHHAIIHWLFEQLPGNVLFVNRILGRKEFYAAGLTWEPDYFIYNFEDETPKVALQKLANHAHLYNFSGPHIDILILRDPYNLFASRLKMDEIIKRAGKVNTSPVGMLSLATWKEYACEFMNPAVLTDPICLNYNRWSADYDYRASIAERIGFEFTDEGYAFVPSFGGGSSFDKDLDGSEMSLNKRYLCYRDFLYRFLDDETKRLSEQLFDLRPF